MSGQPARRARPGAGPQAAVVRGRAAYNPGMLEAMKALAERSVMERLVLLVNHVISAEPAAIERLRPHAARTMQIELDRLADAAAGAVGRSPFASRRPGWSNG